MGVQQITGTSTGFKYRMCVAALFPSHGILIETTQAAGNYLNNHRYQGISADEVKLIQKKEDAVKDKDIYEVMAYLYPAEIERMASADERTGIWATKMKRAAKEHYLGFSEESRDAVMATVERWRNHGYPPRLQDK